jgi:hypothetical protein
MTRDEMRLAGYPDSAPLIDVCAASTEFHCGVSSTNDILCLLVSTKGRISVSLDS